MVDINFIRQNPEKGVLNFFSTDSTLTSANFLLGKTKVQAVIKPVKESQAKSDKF
ncbi:MAG: hypothetical protein M1142_01245 [Patescibacteria group bacterium]|nr:hypothetical protein [Patescibacteria group bacterium]